MEATRSGNLTVNASGRIGVGGSFVDFFSFFRQNKVFYALFRAEPQ